MSVPLVYKDNTCPVICHSDLTNVDQLTASPPLVSPSLRLVLFGISHVLFVGTTSDDHAGLSLSLSLSLYVSLALRTRALGCWPR